MKLTEALIEKYIDDAKIIISRSYPSFIPPIIVKIKLSKARSYWAQIQHIKHDEYEIRVSNIFNEINNDYQFHIRLISCMIHELIHTIPGCWNHGKKFKHVASIVKRSNTKYDICTATSSIDFGIPDSEEPTRYIVICSHCKNEIHYKRRPRIWQYLNMTDSPYLCALCNHSHFIGRTVDT